MGWSIANVRLRSASTSPEGDAWVSMGMSGRPELTLVDAGKSPAKRSTILMVG
jgi:hypothetical protein